MHLINTYITYVILLRFFCQRMTADSNVTISTATRGDSTDRSPRFLMLDATFDKTVSLWKKYKTVDHKISSNYTCFVEQDCRVHYLGFRRSSSDEKHELSSAVVELSNCLCEQN